MLDCTDSVLVGGVTNKKATDRHSPMQSGHFLKIGVIRLMPAEHDGRQMRDEAAHETGISWVGTP